MGVGRVWYAYTVSKRRRTKGRREVSTPIIPRMSPEAVRATQERRRSGAAGKHADKRDKRVRTRSAQRARALKEW